MRNLLNEYLIDVCVRYQILNNIFANIEVQCYVIVY